MRKPNIFVFRIFIWVGAIALCNQLFLTLNSINKASDTPVEITAEEQLEAPNIEIEDSDLRQRASYTLKAKPIDDEVFFQLAYDSYIKTGYWDKIELLHIGHKRNPRNKRILVALGNAHLRKEDLPSTISVLDLLLRLDPKNREMYYQILSSLYAAKVGANEIDHYLINIPVWGHDFINREINTATLTNIDNIYFSLNQFSRNNNNTERITRMWEQLIKKYVTLGKTKLAYDIWLSRTGENLDLSDVKNTKGIFDPNFKEPKALQPFNWVLSNRQSITSERDAGAGLFVSYNDVKPSKIAWQVFPLGSNPSQVLSSQASWAYSNDQGYFEWRFICSGSKKVFGKLVFNDRGQSGSTIDEPIDISDVDCPFAELQLWGVPGAYSKRISINVSSVFVTGLGQESDE